MSGSSPYQVPPQPGRWRAITLAVIVHLALVAFLWIGIHWQNKPPLVVEAEIWDPQIKEAAPLPPPDPEPELAQPTPQPQAETPPPKVEDTPVVKPDIALEKEKEKKRKEQEKLAKLALEKQRKTEQDKQAKLELEKQAKADRLKKEKQDADKKLAQQKEEADAQKKKDVDKLAAEKQQKQQAADSKAADQRRLEETKRLLSQASSSSGGAGDAAKSQGPRGNPDYAQKLIAIIVRNTAFAVPPDLAGNPPVEYAVDLFPDGSVRSIRLAKPSGVPGFDEAVLRAINKSQPFPADKDGKVPNSIFISHTPKKVSN